MVDREPKRIWGLPIRTMLRLLGLLVALGLAGLALVTGGRDALDEIWAIPLGWLIAALLVLAAGALLGAAAWWLLVRAVGGPLPLRAGFAIAQLSQLGKYVPGMVAVPILQADLGRSHGIKAREILTAFSLTLVLAVMAALVVGLGGLALSASDLARDYLWLLVLLIPLPIVMSSRALSVLLGAGLRAIRRPAGFSISGHRLRLAFVVQLLATIVGGLHVWFLAIGLGADPLEALLPSVAGMSLAWVVGFLVAFAPAGLGVREGVLFLVMEPIVGAAQAVAIAIVSRFLFTVMDVILAGVALYIWRRLPEGGSDPLPEARGHSSTG